MTSLLCICLFLFLTANGFIDKNEFYQMMEAQKGKEKQNVQEAFKKFDRDGNGYIRFVFFSTELHDITLIFVILN